MRDHVYTLKVWSDKCLNMPIVTRAHAPATGRGHARGRLQGARRVGARLLRLAPGDDFRHGRLLPGWPRAVASSPHPPVCLLWRIAYGIYRGA